MGEVELHATAEEALVVDALEGVTAKGGSAVVVHGTGGDARLVAVGALVGALRASGDVAMKLEEVPDGDPLAAGAIRAVSTGRVRVTIEDPSRAIALNTSTMLCRCTADPTHVFEPSELAIPGLCNIDGGPVVCR